jgi:hypothetical protein
MRARYTRSGNKGEKESPGGALILNTPIASIKGFAAFSVSSSTSAAVFFSARTLTTYVKRTGVFGSTRSGVQSIRPSPPSDVGQP